MYYYVLITEMRMVLSKNDCFEIIDKPEVRKNKF